MADVNQVLLQFMDTVFSPSNKIKVATNFKGQMGQIKKMLKNDTTGMISTIQDFMIKSATVDINFEASNANLTNLFTDWSKNVNKGLNIDIPSGLRGFTEQYFRERWTSSFIVVKIVWGKNSDNYTVPVAMYVYDGASIIPKNDARTINGIKYYFGKVKDSKILQNTEKETIFVRKPYNQWYDLYPTPYYVRRGTLYHGLFKNQILEKQAEMLSANFPYQLMLKLGTMDTIKRGMGPSEKDLQDAVDRFKGKKAEEDDQIYSKALIGAYPGDVKVEEFIPDYIKTLDEKIMKGVDKNLLTSLGMIELKGFSQTREEAILNPKVLIEEVIDGVNDYVELLEEIVELTRDKNKSKYKMGDHVSVSSGIIESFITDEMRTLIRSWYDRGIVAYEDALESTTPLKFKTQLIKREKENKNKEYITCYPRVVQNLEKDSADVSPVENENIPDDKKPDTPESQNYKNACDESELIVEPMKTIRSIPNEFSSKMDNDEKQIFKRAFNEKFEECQKLEYDKWFTHQACIEYASGKVLEYIEAPYKTNKDLPSNVSNPLPSDAQTIWRNVFNQSVTNGDSEDVARKKAWVAVKRGFKKNKDGNWVKK
jgi:cation transport regulator ChaB